MIAHGPRLPVTRQWRPMGEVPDDYADYTHLLGTVIWIGGHFCPEYVTIVYRVGMRWYALVGGPAVVSAWAELPQPWREKPVI